MSEKPVAVEPEKDNKQENSPGKKPKSTIVRDAISKGKTITGSKPDEIKINPMLEAVEKTAVIGMARMNPPTTGHHKFIKKIEDEAKKVGGSAHVILSHSTGNTKNPLTPEQKKQYVKKLVQPGTHVEMTSSEAPSMLHQASRIHNHAHHLVVVGSSGKGDQDRANQFHELLTKYNGVHGPHGYYKFKSIKKVSSGDRDPDAGGTEGISGTKMREHAINGDVKSFKKGLPKELHDHAEEMIRSIQKVKDIEPVKKKKIKESVNSIGSTSIRGLGNVTGDPKLNDSTENKYISGNIADSDNKNNILKLAKQTFHDKLHKEDVDAAFEQMIDEGLNAQQRMRKAVDMRRMEYKLQMSKKRSMSRRAPTNVIVKRARKEAIDKIKSKLAGNRDMSTLSAMEKSRIESILKRRKQAVARLTRRLVAQVRKREQARFTPKNEDISVLFDIYDVLVEKKLDLKDTHKREQGTNSLRDIYARMTPGQTRTESIDQTFLEMFGKQREVLSRHGQDRKKMSLVPRGDEDRKTDDRFYRQQQIQKKIIDEKRGLWDNIHAKQERIKHGSGEHMRKPGSKGAPTKADFERSQNEEVKFGPFTFKKTASGKWDGAGEHELHDNGKPTGITISSGSKGGRSYHIKNNGKHVTSSSTFDFAKSSAISHHLGTEYANPNPLDEDVNSMFEDYYGSVVPIEEGMDYHAALNKTMKALGIARKHLSRGSKSTPAQKARATIQHAFLSRQSAYLRQRIAADTNKRRFQPGKYRRTMREDLDINIEFKNMFAEDTTTADVTKYEGPMVRTAAGKIIKIKKEMSRAINGKKRMAYPGKSSSSGGGDD